MKTWVKTGLIWALWMFIFMSFVAPYIYVWIGIEDETTPKFETSKIIINAVVFTVAGLIWGYWTFKRNKAPKKQIDS